MSVETGAREYADILERAAARDRTRVALLAALWIVGGATAASIVWRWSARFDKLDRDLRGLSLRVDNVDETLDKSELARKQAIALAEDARRQVATLQGPIATLQSSVTKGYEDLVRLQRDQNDVASELTTQINQWREDLHDVSTRVQAAQQAMDSIDKRLRKAREDLDTVLQTSTPTFRTNRWDKLAGTDLFFGLGNWKDGTEGISSFCVSNTENGACLPLKAADGSIRGAGAPLRFGESVQLVTASCLYTIVARSGTRVQFSRADQVKFDIRCEPLP